MELVADSNPSGVLQKRSRSRDSSGSNGRQVKILYVTIGDPEYSRTRILINGLKSNGAFVVEFHFRREESFFLKKLVRFRTLNRSLDYDVLWVGSSGHFMLPFFRLIAKGPIIFDAYFSVYQTVVHDKARCAPDGARALFWRLVDVAACRLSDRVILDTRSQIDYFLREFRLWPGKFECVPVGADENVFTGECEPDVGEEFTVLFWGSFIPLQGVDVIVEAARRLAGMGVSFVMVGDGPGRDSVQAAVEANTLEDVKLRSRVREHELAVLQSRADICLGIFGRTEKAQQVVPNKAYAAIASARPLITGDSPAAREVFSHGRNAWLVPHGDAEALAEAIIFLREHPSRRNEIARAGFELFKRHYSIPRVGATAIEAASNMLNARRVQTPPPQKAFWIGEKAEIDPAMMCDHRPDLEAHVPANARMILDVGCGMGYLGRLLKARGNVVVVGVETCTGAAIEARKYLDAVYSNYDQLTAHCGKRHFDCMIFGDVLEHMSMPTFELARYVKLLQGGGTLVASLPNVAHWSVIWSLVCNRFRYSERGILCHSHLRFFTRRSATELLGSAGLTVREVHPNYRLLDVSVLGFPLRLGVVCRVLALGVLKHLFAFQYRFVATKTSDTGTHKSDVSEKN